MNTIKITFTISPAESWACEWLTAQLADSGFESFVETAEGVEAYIGEDLYNPAQIEEIIAGFSENFSVSWLAETIAEQNWNEVWEKNYFKPLVIQNRCVVRAPFHDDYPACEYEIVIEPNMAFGTGNHETTSMMMEILLEEELAGKEVLDMGCGTGILAILASKRGAAHITAIDIDHWAFEATVENAQTNHIENLTAWQGDASRLGAETYDLILANIQKNVLINDLPVYAPVLRKGGKILLSGFYLPDLDDIRHAAQTSGLSFINYRERNNWTVAIFEKPAN